MSRLFLTLLGYTLIAMITEKCGISYDQALKTISGIGEGVYSDASHSHAEYTREQTEASGETQDRVVVIKRDEVRLLWWLIP